MLKHLVTRLSYFVVFGAMLVFSGIPVHAEGRIGTTISMQNATLSICELSANRNGNLHSGPANDLEVVNYFFRGGQLKADGQNQTADGTIWWHLVSGSWVREDYIVASDKCLQLPTKSV